MLALTSLLLAGLQPNGKWNLIILSTLATTRHRLFTSQIPTKLTSWTFGLEHHTLLVSFGLLTENIACQHLYRSALVNMIHNMR